MVKILTFLKSNSVAFLAVLLIFVLILSLVDKELAKFLGTAGFLFLIVRGFVDWTVARDLEKYKAGLEREAIRFKIRYEGLYGERALVTKEVYKRLVKTERAFRSLMSPIQFRGEKNREDKAGVVTEKADALQDYFFENRIFFEEEVASKIDELLDEFWSAWIRFLDSAESKEAGEPHGAELKEARKVVNDRIPPLKKAIEQKFRSIVGFDRKA